LKGRTLHFARETGGKGNGGGQRGNVEYPLPGFQGRLEKMFGKYKGNGRKVKRGSIKGGGERRVQ